MTFYRRVARPLMFRIAPERAHSLAMALLRLATNSSLGRTCLEGLFGTPRKTTSTELWEMPFNGYVGLAAGFDKAGLLLDHAACMGFSFMEVGTITPKPQPGNPQPRLFRLTKDKALINRMGFNSPGVAAVEKRLAQKRSHRIPIFANIGKNTATDNIRATDDYLQVFSQLYPIVDAFVINVSCPNVQSLCQLQSAESLRSLLAPVMKFRAQQGLYRPILLKLGPDTSPEAIRSAVQTAQTLGVDAFVASNTTNNRAHLTTEAQTIETIGRGGLSGEPLLRQALNLVKTIRESAVPGTPIIGVGGVTRGEDALAMLQAGASLVEVFTGFIYEGPAMARRINRYLTKHQAEIPNWLNS